jgi:hypothetical protein
MIAFTVSEHLRVAWGETDVMPGINELEVGRLVRNALSALSTAQRSAVDRILRSPQAFAALVADPANVEAVAGIGPQLYHLRVTPRLRLVYEETADGFRIVDLVDQATLELLAAEKVRKEQEAELLAQTAIPEAPPQRFPRRPLPRGRRGR